MVDSKSNMSKSIVSRPILACLIQDTYSCILLCKRKLCTYLRSHSDLSASYLELFHSKNPSLYMKFLMSYILSVIEYCMITYVGNSKSSVRIVECIQRTFTRILFVPCHHSLQVPSYEERLELFGLHKLSTRLNIIEPNDAL